MDAVFCMQTVAADAAADAAISNIRKQRELEMELKHIDKQWLFALKKIVNDRLDLIKEVDKIAKVKVHRDYFRGDLKKAKLHNYTDHARSRMLEEKYYKSHDNFDFTVDPLSKQAVPQPMIMESDGKSRREEITSTYLDKSKVKHIRGLSELEVKVRRFRVPKFRKKKKRSKQAQLPPIQQKPKRVRRLIVSEPEFSPLEELKEEEQEQQATSITIQYAGEENPSEGSQSVFTTSEKILPRLYIPLPPVMLTPEPSFEMGDAIDSGVLKPPQSPSGIRPRLLSPIPSKHQHVHTLNKDDQNDLILPTLKVTEEGDQNEDIMPTIRENSVLSLVEESVETSAKPSSPQPPQETDSEQLASPPKKSLKLIIPESANASLVPDPSRVSSHQDSNSLKSPKSPGSFLPPSPRSPIPPHLKKISKVRRESIDKENMSEISQEFFSVRRGSIPYPRRSSISMLPKNHVTFALPPKSVARKSKQQSVSENGSNAEPRSILKGSKSLKSKDFVDMKKEGKLISRPLPPINQQANRIIANNRSENRIANREPTNKQRFPTNSSRRSLSSSTESLEGKPRATGPDTGFSDKVRLPAIPTNSKSKRTSDLFRSAVPKRVNSQTPTSVHIVHSEKAAIRSNESPFKSVYEPSKNIKGEPNISLGGEETDNAYSGLSESVELEPGPSTNTEEQVTRDSGSLDKEYSSSTNTEEQLNLNIYNSRACDDIDRDINTDTHEVNEESNNENSLSITSSPNRKLSTVLEEQ